MNKKARSRRELFAVLFGLTLIGVTLACGFSAAAPRSIRAPAATEPAPAFAGTPPLSQPTVEALALVAPAVPVAPPLSLPEYRRLTLEFPPQMRVGDSEIVRLTLEVDTLGNITPTAQFQGNIVKGKTVQIPNLYDTHNIVAEARLDLAGPEIRPNGAIDEPLLPSQAVTFYWSIQPTETGTYQGTVWLTLIFVDKVTKEETRETISAQPLQIESMNLFGLDGTAARATGSIGAIIGAVLGFPFVSDIIKWLIGRLIRNTK